MAENKDWIEETFEKIDKKMSEVTKRPRAPFRPQSWTAGFWGATSELLYERTKNEDYPRSAEENMMNLPILYFASEHIGDDRFKRNGMAHADNAIRTHLRADGSVHHCVEHDRETGDAIETFGVQGIAVGSSWSRGRAWAIYGYALSYLHTKEVRYPVPGKHPLEQPGVHQHIIYSDFFFTEAVLKLLGSEFNPW